MSIEKSVDELKDASIALGHEQAREKILQFLEMFEKSMREQIDSDVMRSKLYFAGADAINVAHTRIKEMKFDS